MMIQYLALILLPIKSTCITHPFISLKKRILLSPYRLTNLYIFYLFLSLSALPPFTLKDKKCVMIDKELNKQTIF